MKRVRNNQRSKNRSNVTDRKLKLDEEIDSSGIESNDEDNNVDDDSSINSDEIQQSAEQKRLRMAKNLLDQLGSNDDMNVLDNDENHNGIIGDDDDLNENTIAKKLERDRLEAQGRLHKNVADNLNTSSSMNALISTSQTLLGHEASVTCVTLSNDSSRVYSGSKDNSVICWDLTTGKKLFLIPTWKQAKSSSTSNTSDDDNNGVATNSRDCEVLSITSSTDGRYVCWGGRDKKVHIWDVRSNTKVKTLSGHRGAINSMCFRRGAYSLYTASDDRAVKTWDLNEMGYMETLFGHQEAVMSMDCWTQETPISSGGDRTLRSWKIAHETHLVYRGHKASIDCVTMLNDNHFASGGQDGTIHLWKDSQKKPVAAAQMAHGTERSSIPRWITSLTALKMSDLIVSGSHDGMMRLWQADAEKRLLQERMALPVHGVINTIAVSSDIIVAGTGKDHKYGRWISEKKAENALVIYRMPDRHELKSDSTSDSEDESEEQSGSEDERDNNDSGSNSGSVSGSVSGSGSVDEEEEEDSVDESAGESN